MQQQIFLDKTCAHLGSLFLTRINSNTSMDKCICIHLPSKVWDEIPKLQPLHPCFIKRRVKIFFYMFSQCASKLRHLGVTASQIIDISTVCSTVCADKHQSSVSLVLCEGYPSVNSPHEEPIMQKAFVYNIIMILPWQGNCLTSIGISIIKIRWPSYLYNGNSIYGKTVFILKQYAGVTHTIIQWA